MFSSNFSLGLACWLMQANCLEPASNLLAGFRGEPLIIGRAVSILVAQIVSSLSLFLSGSRLTFLADSQMNHLAHFEMSLCFGVLFWRSSSGSDRFLVAAAFKVARCRPDFI